MSETVALQPHKTATLFFDTLMGGLKPLDPEEARAIRESGYLARLRELEQASRAAGVRVFYTQPEHRQDGSDWGVTIIGTPPLPTTYKGINYRGSRHAEILDDIAPQPGDYIIAKHRWSAFFQTSLELSLRTAGIDTIILAGGATEIGIASTAYAGRDRDFNLIVARDACRSNHPDLDELWMDGVFPRLARVLTVAEVTDLLSRPG